MQFPCPLGAAYIVGCSIGTLKCSAPCIWIHLLACCICTSMLFCSKLKFKGATSYHECYGQMNLMYAARGAGIGLQGWLQPALFAAPCSIHSSCMTHPAVLLTLPYPAFSTCTQPPSPACTCCMSSRSEEEWLWRHHSCYIKQC